MKKKVLRVNRRTPFCSAPLLAGRVTFNSTAGVFLDLVGRVAARQYRDHPCGRHWHAPRGEDRCKLVIPRRAFAGDENVSGQGLHRTLHRTSVPLEDADGVLAAWGKRPGAPADLERTGPPLVPKAESNPTADGNAIGVGLELLGGWVVDERRHVRALPRRGDRVAGCWDPTVTTLPIAELVVTVESPEDRKYPEDGALVTFEGGDRTRDDLPQHQGDADGENIPVLAERRPR